MSKENREPKLVEFINGQSAIGTIEEQSAGVFRMYSPTKVIITERGMGMVPYNLFIDLDKVKHIDFKSEHVMFVTEPNDELKRFWQEKYGGGVVTLPAKKILQI